MGYTAAARQALLAAFGKESTTAGWSATYIYLQMRALATVPLGTTIDVEEEDLERVGVDDYTPGFVPDFDVERDVARVALQADYFGIDPHA